MYCLAKFDFAYLPEILNDNIILRVSTVISVLLPVIDIDVGNTADEQLEFTLVEDIYQVGWDELVESSDESIELLLDALLDSPFGDELNILLLVLVCDFDIPAAWLQVNRDLLSEPFVLDGECAVDDVCNVVLHGPSKCPMELSIHTLHVLKRHLLLQDHLVKRSNEECIQESSMEDGQADNATNKFEVSKMFRVNARVRVDLECIVVVRRVFEKTVERIEHLVREKEKEFSIGLSVLHASITDSFDSP